MMKVGKRARLSSPRYVHVVEHSVLIVCMGNLCFGKCGILHCGLWVVQTIYFLYTQHMYRMLKCTCITIIVFGDGQCAETYSVSSSHCH